MSRTLLKEMLDDQGPPVPESSVAKAYIRAYVENYHASFRALAYMRNEIDAAEMAWLDCESHFDVDAVVRAFRKSPPPLREHAFYNQFSFWFNLYAIECAPVYEVRMKWTEEDKLRFGE